MAWGWNGWGQQNVPPPNASFVGLAAGAWHTLGVKSPATLELSDPETVLCHRLPSPPTRSLLALRSL
jgi:hypothetical protein